MLGMRRGRKESAEGAGAGPTITADLAGAVITGGQVAVGENITQLYAEAGSVLNYVAPKGQPHPRLRQLPVLRLPRDFPRLLGREPQLEAATEAIASGSPVEFFGEPGIGKSVLLRHLAHHLGQRPPEGTIHHAAAGEPLGDSLQFVFESFYECETTFVPTPAQLGEYLGERRALLILDDLELERDDLERLMDALPWCSLLSASAGRRLWGEGEAIELEGLGEGEALALVEGEVGRALSGEEREAARSLWRSVQGHPLRLLQAAAEIRRGLGATQLAEIAGAGTGALEKSLGGSLTQEKRALLEALSAVPAGSVHIDDLAEVTGAPDVDEQLKALEERSLVQSHSPRYTVAPNLRGKLVAEPQRDRWRERLVSHFASRGDELREPADGPVALGLLQWAASTGGGNVTLRLARVLDRSFSLGGRWGSWLLTLDIALGAARRLGDRAAEAWSLHQLGSRALCLGDREAARASLTAALEMREALGDEQGAAITRHNLELLSAGPPIFRGNGRRWLSWPVVLIAALVTVAAAVATPLLLAGGSKGPSPNPQNQAAPANGPAPAPGNPPPGGTPPGGTAKPNLVVSAVDGNVTGRTCEVSYTLENAGTAPAGLSKTQITFVDDNDVSHALTQHAAALDPGQTQTGKESLDAPCPLPATATVEADVADSVKESNENDNSAQQEWGAEQETTSTTSSTTSTSTTSSATSTTSTSTSTTSIIP